MPVPLRFCFCRGHTWSSSGCQVGPTGERSATLTTSRKTTKATYTLCACHAQRSGVTLWAVATRAKKVRQAFTAARDSFAGHGRRWACNDDETVRSIMRHLRNGQPPDPVNGADYWSGPAPTPCCEARAQGRHRPSVSDSAKRTSWHGRDKPAQWISRAAV